MKAGQRKRVWTAEQKKELGYKHYINIGVQARRSRKELLRAWLLFNLLCAGDN